MIANEFYVKLVHEIYRQIAKHTNKNDELNKLKKKLICLQSRNKTENVIHRLKHHLHKNIKFDSNPYMIVFTNGVYDLKQFKFYTKTKKTGYISNAMTTGYDFYVPSKKDMQFLTDYMNKTFINPKDDKNVYFMFLTTVLIGKNYKKFCINNGSGNNNKSNFMEFVHAMVGD